MAKCFSYHQIIYLLLVCGCLRLAFLWRQQSGTSRLSSTAETNDGFISSVWPFSQLVPGASTSSRISSRSIRSSISRSDETVRDIPNPALQQTGDLRDIVAANLGEVEDILRDLRPADQHLPQEHAVRHPPPTYTHDDADHLLQPDTSPTHLTLNSTIRDRHWLDFLPYLRGMYQQNFTCHSDCRGFTRHLNAVNDAGGKSPPNFSCNSSIAPIIFRTGNSGREQKTRPQLTIRCEGSRASGVVEDVSFDSPIQTFGDPASRECLHLYIKQHCYGEFPVPNIVHWIYFGDAYLNLRKAIAFYR